MKSVGLRLFLFALLGLILSIVPIPSGLSFFRPAWIALLLLYIQFYLPRYFNFILIFILGCCLDVLLHTPMGEHALALVLMSWMANAKSRRMHFFTMGQQMIMIGLFCFIYQLSLQLIDAFSGSQYILWMPFASAGTSLLLWPWIRILLDDTFLIKKYR